LHASVELIGRYRLRTLLGTGGMGEVWLAIDLKLDRSVAVKALPAGIGTDALLAARFRREAKIAAALQHPGITTVLDYDMYEERLFLVMEFLDGEDLAKVLSRFPKGLPLEDVFDLGRQAADALAADHSRQVVHRDIKPTNLMLLSDRRLKICDFGIARFVDSTHLTTQGVIGTPRYMAPEQFSSGDVDHRADLYSLGCVLFEMVTGSPPFSSEHGLPALMHQHMKVRPTSPRTSRPQVPGNLETLLLALLAKQAADRPSSADEVARELSAISVDVAAAPIFAAQQTEPDTQSEGASEEASIAGVLERLRAYSTLSPQSPGYRCTVGVSSTVRFAIWRRRHGNGIAWRAHAGELRQRVGT
jgi:serine/threonine protein kinase